MKTLNLSRYALSISVAVTLLAGCGGAQVPSTSAPLTATNARTVRTVPALGGAFSGAYSGTYTRTVGKYGINQMHFSGAGKASFLRRSNESVVLGGQHHRLGWSGYATLTSSKNPANAINVDFPDQVKGMCRDPFSYTVNGGTGKFTKATGSGTVIFKCHFGNPYSGPYSDKWSGTLYY